MSEAKSKERKWGWGWYILVGLIFMSIQKVFKGYGEINGIEIQTILTLSSLFISLFVYFYLRNKILLSIKKVKLRSFISGTISFISTSIIIGLLANILVANFHTKNGNKEVFDLHKNRESIEIDVNILESLNELEQKDYSEAYVIFTDTTSGHFLQFSVDPEQKQLFFDIPIWRENIEQNYDYYLTEYSENKNPPIKNDVNRFITIEAEGRIIKYLNQWSIPYDYFYTKLIHPETNNVLGYERDIVGHPPVGNKAKSDFVLLFFRYAYNVQNPSFNIEKE